MLRRNIPVYPHAALLNWGVFWGLLLTGDAAASMYFSSFLLYLPALALSDAAEGGATRLFGKNGEPVSAPKQDTGFFDAIVQKKSTNAVFVGHDHLNHLAVRYRGVDLVDSR